MRPSAGVRGSRRTVARAMGELTQLRGIDIIERNGIHAMKIFAGSRHDQNRTGAQCRFMRMSSSKASLRS